MIQVERIKTLNNTKIADNPFIIYWMQSSQRIECNHALQYAIRKANELKKPLIVYFGVTDSYPEANERHYRFMLEGLMEVRDDLRKRNIRMLIEKVSPEKGALKISANAALMVTDRGYLRTERSWRDYLASNAACPVVQVESNVMVPVETLSDKEEYSAATLRRKMNRLMDEFTAALTDDPVLISSLNIDFNFNDFDFDDLDKALGQLDIDRSVRPVEAYTGGTRHAIAHLEDFMENKLHKYSQLKNEPSLDYSSNLSPYLHFGQISPLYIYRRLLDVGHENKEDFLEELIVRRELAMNFIYYNNNYDTLDSLHSWAKTTLKEHVDDKREYIYSLNDFENANTHDVYWNAAQKEMILTGKMHGYMRMYWGKKILQWSKTPDEAFKTALFLNNKYNLDGRDPNGFTGVAWCFGKHDRGWKEREIFGKVRYMNAQGLERKFDMKKYLKKIESLQDE